MKRIMILGGGADQIDFIEDLKRRGYFVIVIDYTNNPLAKPYADLHIQESTLDVEKVKRIAEGLEVERIIAVCTDQALMTVATVSEMLNLPTQFSAKQVRCFTKKKEMKEIMTKNGIPTAKFKVIKSFMDSTDDLRYPLIVKPSDCNSSKGVRKANNRKEFEQYVTDALKLSRTSTAIVEEFLEGTEVSIDAYVTSYGVKILMVGALGKKFIDNATQLIYQNTIPANISSIARDKIKDIAQNIASAFNIHNSPLLIQAIVSGDEINVIEFSARLGGGCKHHTIREVTGIDIVKANIDSLLGIFPDLISSKQTQKIISRVHLYLKPGIISKISGLKEAKDTGTIKEYVINKPNGTIFGHPKASTDRLGSILIEADSTDELNAKKQKALDSILIVDNNGESLLDNSIYCSK